MTPHRATLVEVAERAGVSLASTSRALHGTGASSRMVDRVRTAAAELGYRPHATGRSLRTQRTFQVAFAVADIGNPVYVEMLTSIHEVLSPHGYRMVVTSTGDTVVSTVDLVRSLDSGFVDGMVISPLRIDDDFVRALRESAVPVVVIGRSLAEHGIDSVSTDSAGGIGQAVAHLLDGGRRRIGFLNGPLDTTPGQSRRRGFEEATAAVGSRAELTETQQADDFTVTAGVDAAEQLLDRAAAVGTPLDAIVAANDLLAIGAIRAASRRGLSVPRDLAVTGMDDTEIGRVFQPSLTSVSLDSGRRGRLAAELMLGLLDGGAEPGQQLTVDPRLLVRESSVGSLDELAHRPTRKEDA